MSTAHEAPSLQRGHLKRPLDLPGWASLVRAARWHGPATAITVGLVLALISSVPMPRGPVTGPQALIVVLASLIAGTAIGRVARSRWSLVLAPIAYAAGYELARLGLAGASLDGIRLDSSSGIAAFVSGRGFHGLLALVPLVAGVTIGIASTRPRRILRLAWTGSLALAVIGLGVSVALPGSAPPILGANGQPVPGSVAELTTVSLGGQDQVISIRAADPDTPVLLYLSGGPGQSDIAYARVLLEPLVEDFVVVAYDQRGSGMSYPALDPTASLTLDQAVADTVELTEYLRQRFAEDKIYLLGESWGTTLGVLAAQQRPDLFHAYIGSGQMVSQSMTDRIIWRDLLAYADRIGDGELYDKVLTLGEPPYRDTPWANSFVMGYYDAIGTSYTPPAAYIERGEASGVGPFGIFGSEYGVVDKANVIRGLVDVFSILYPQLQQIDLRADVPRLDVPVYLLDGANELRGRRDLALEWFAGLTAPTKRLITYPDAGHSVVFEMADAFHALMNQEIVPVTYRNP